MSCAPSLTAGHLSALISQSYCSCAWGNDERQQRQRGTGKIAEEHFSYGTELNTAIRATVLLQKHLCCLNSTTPVCDAVRSIISVCVRSLCDTIL